MGYELLQKISDKRLNIHIHTYVYFHKFATHGCFRLLQQGIQNLKANISTLKIHAANPHTSRISQNVAAKETR